MEQAKPTDPGGHNFETLSLIEVSINVFVFTQFVGQSKGRASGKVLQWPWPPALAGGRECSDKRRPAIYSGQTIFANCDHYF